MKVIGLAPNPQKAEALRLTAELAQWLAQMGIRVAVTEDVAEATGRPDLAATVDGVIETDLLLVLGGDGTMLHWSRLAAQKGTPTMGVNFGQYGFITEVHPQEAKSAVQTILDGNYVISERVVMEASITRDGKPGNTYYALNDVVVSKGPLARMVGLHTFINEKFIVTYSADGIIVATPTGSTAYSLSAGGPVVHPNVRVIIITPICPHTLNARSLVVSDTETVQIVGQCNAEGKEMTLTVDGQHGEYLTCSDKVSVRKADFSAKLVQLSPQSFYDKLQSRLRWGERFSGQ